MHCCISLGEVDKYYSFSHRSPVFKPNKAYCEVVPYGRAIKIGGKVCCSRLYIKRKLNKFEILKRLFLELYSDNFNIRCWAIEAILDIYKYYSDPMGATIFDRYDIYGEHVLSILKKSIGKAKNNELNTYERLMDLTVLERQIDKY